MLEFSRQTFRRLRKPTDKHFFPSVQSLCCSASTLDALKRGWPRRDHSDPGQCLDSSYDNLRSWTRTTHSLQSSLPWRSIDVRKWLVGHREQRCEKCQVFSERNLLNSMRRKAPGGLWEPGIQYDLWPSGHRNTESEIKPKDSAGPGLVGSLQAVSPSNTGQR